MVKVISAVLVDQTEHFLFTRPVEFDEQAWLDTPVQMVDRTITRQECLRILGIKKINTYVLD